jgi:ATP-dependent Clp protease ATP-binding subunit ClpA
MIWKLFQWLFLIGILLYIGSVLIGLLSFVVFIVLITIAVCSLYVLLPENFRLPMLETWLDPDWQPPSRPAPYSPYYPPPNKSSSPQNGSNLPMTQYQQPHLNFENVTASLRGQIPNREELTTYLKNKVIGQDEAIETLVRLVIGKLAAANYSKPLVILLPGTTGTGKTELSKALAESLGTKLHRFDMGEYADSFKSSNLMGSARGFVGSEEGGALPNALRQSKKFCILLFDEVEKAHQSLWRQLLAFFDEGRITDTLGIAIAPKNTICLMTSNLAAEQIAQNPEAAKDILRDTKFFPPEFIGRVNKIIALPKLNKADSARLTVILAKRVAIRHGINLVIEQDALPELVQETFDEGEKYGGRGIEERISDLFIDDFIDLQTGRITDARLVVLEGVLRAVPFD